MVSRALAILHSCIYDAWAAYDERALGTRFGGALRRPFRERTEENRPDDQSTDRATPTGVGNLACGAVLDFRHNDGSNQLGDLTPAGTPYADYTGYQPVNPPARVPFDSSTVVDINRWQHFQLMDAAGNLVTQQFVGPHWYNVTRFALRSGNQVGSDSH